MLLLAFKTHVIHLIAPGACACTPVLALYIHLRVIAAFGLMGGKAWEGKIPPPPGLSDDRVELMWRAKIEASKADSRAKSLNPVAAASASTKSGSTAGHLLGQLSKLSTHVHAN